MRVVIQRVSEAQVCVNGQVIAAIKAGACVFVGLATGDGERDADYLADRVANLRIFEDESGKMNRSLADMAAEALIVSEFTLYGDCRQGRRPSFSRALAATDAEKLYTYFLERVRSHGIKVKAGKFRSAMRVGLVNDGPVTLILDSRP